MIVKIGKRGDMAGAVRYLYSHKEGVERENPRIIGGLGRDGEALGPENGVDVARELDAMRELHGTTVTVPVRDAEKRIVGRQDAHVWTCALTLKESERVLDDGEWLRIADGTMRAVDLGDVRYIVVRHGVNASGCDHVHIVASGVCEDGSKARYFQDWDRASTAANALEHAHGLAVVEGRELGIGRRGYLRGEREIAETHPGGKRNETQRWYYERAIRGCMVESRGPDEWAAKLERGGIHVKWDIRNGRRSGYSVVGADGVPYAGGKIARDLTYPRLLEHWNTATPETADQAARLAAGQLAARSLRAERAGHAGPIARESRDLGRYAQTRASGSGLVLTAALAAALRERIARANREAELQAERDEHERERRPHSRDRDNGIGF